MKRLLVIRLGALGDLIHLTPALAAVKAARPGMELHLLTGEPYKDLARMMPAVDRVWTWRRGPGGESGFSLAQRLRLGYFDGIVNLHPSLKTCLIAGWAQAFRAGRQAVYHKQKLRRKGVTQRGVTRRHAVQDFYEPFRHLLKLPELPGGPSAIPRLLLPALPEFPRKPEGERWIGIIPGVGAKRSNRAWEEASYLTLIERLLASTPDIRVLLIGGPDEKPLAERLMGGVSPMPGNPGERLENHCGLHDIPETAALLAQCDQVVGGDTGPVHLAAAVGAPLVGIYGPTALSRTGPLGHAVQRLTPPEKLSCWPCEAPVCPLEEKNYMACMRQIDVDTVFSAILSGARR